MPQSVTDTSSLALELGETDDSSLWRGQPDHGVPERRGRCRPHHRGEVASASQRDDACSACCGLPQPFTTRLKPTKMWHEQSGIAAWYHTLSMHMQGSQHVRAPPTYAGEVESGHNAAVHHVFTWPETAQHYETNWTVQSAAMLDRSTNVEERHADMLWLVHLRTKGMSTVCSCSRTCLIILYVVRRSKASTSLFFDPLPKSEPVSSVDPTNL